MRHLVKSMLGSWCGWSAAFCLKSTYSFLGRLLLAVVGFLFLFRFLFVAVVRVVWLVLLGGVEKVGKVVRVVWGRR